MRIETSFYGDLAKFSPWMSAPIAAGLMADYAQVDQGPKDAAAFFKNAGIELVNREVDNSKGYGQSITIDLLAGRNPIHVAGARGTVTENRLMISRVNAYDNLYLEPTGHHLFVEYSDAPGVIGRIAGLLGEKNINIVDIRAPQDEKTGRSLTVVTTNVEVPEMLVEKIGEAVSAIRIFEFSCMA